MFPLSASRDARGRPQQERARACGAPDASPRPAALPEPALTEAPVSAIFSGLNRNP